MREISVFSLNTGKCGPEKTPNLVPFQTLLPISKNEKISSKLIIKSFESCLKFF